MPILKIPIVHRFGIISQNDHLLLEARLAKVAQETSKSRYSNDVAKTPLFEVTEQFVLEYKSAKMQKEKDRLIDVAKKMLTRNKRKAGLSTMGSGEHVKLSVAWTELALLVQCKGKIQEEALDILLISLDHAPFHPDQIPVLFFLAESVLYWICTDSVKQSYLYISEVKIIKVGFLTFLRLFTFHLAGLVRPFEQSKYRLHDFLKGLPQCEPCYQSYPSVLLHIHFIISTGEIICGSLTSCEEHTHVILDEDPNKNSCGQVKKVGCYVLSRISKKLRKDCQSPQQVDEPGQKRCTINPALRECLMVWICVKHNTQLLDDILQHLLHKEQLCKANWIDSTLGLLLLSEAAKINMACLKALKELGIKLITHLSVHNLKQKNVSTDLRVWPLQLYHLYCCILGDICLYGSTPEIQKAALIGCEISSKSADRNNPPGLLDLLQIQPAATPEDEQSSCWWIRYGAAYSLGKVCHILHGDRNREGMKNAAWKALQKHQSLEQDTRVLTAIKVAEAELSGPINPFINISSKTSSPTHSVAVCSLGWRIADVLSQLCLPPVVPYIPLPRLLPQRPILTRPLIQKKMNADRKKVRLSLRQEITLAQAGYMSLPDFNTRANFDLRRIMEDQWRKELHFKMEEEEKYRHIQLEEKQKMDARDFSELMKAKKRHLKKLPTAHEMSV